MAGRGVASAFAGSLFEPGERVAIVLIPRGSAGGRVRQRLLPVEVATSGRVQAWLRYENAQRHDVFLGMNPVARGARGRLKGDIAEVRRLWIDIDDEGPAALAKLRADVRGGRAPQPRHVVETSPERYQVIWSAREPLRPGRAEAAMRGLVARYGADPAAVDVARVLRWPGFRNHKRGASDLVRVRSFPGAPAVQLGDFKGLPRPPQRPGGRPRGRRRVEPWAGKGSQSERDWAWVHRRLARGGDPGVIAGELARRRDDKPNPGYYAELTVRKALEARRAGPGPER